MSRESRHRLLHDLWMEIRRFQTAQDQFDEAAYGRLGLNRSDGRALDVCEQEGGLTAGGLARELGLSTGATTTLLDRLERAGMIRRVRDEGDRRRVLVELTESAHAHNLEVWGPIAADAEEALSRYSDEELLLIAGFMRRGREAMLRHIARVESLPPPPGTGA